MSVMDMFSLKGKNALVIGGSKGLGEGIARGLVEAGRNTARPACAFSS